MLKSSAWIFEVLFVVVMRKLNLLMMMILNWLNQANKQKTTDLTLQTKVEVKKFISTDNNHFEMWDFVCLWVFRRHKFIFLLCLCRDIQSMHLICMSGMDFLDSLVRTSQFGFQLPIGSQPTTTFEKTSIKFCCALDSLSSRRRLTMQVFSSIAILICSNFLTS